MSELAQAEPNLERVCPVHQGRRPISYTLEPPQRPFATNCQPLIEAIRPEGLRFCEEVVRFRAEAETAVSRLEQMQAATIGQESGVLRRNFNRFVRGQDEALQRAQQFSASGDAAHQEQIRLVRDIFERLRRFPNRARTLANRYEMLRLQNKCAPATVGVLDLEVNPNTGSIHYHLNDLRTKLYSRNMQALLNIEGSRRVQTVLASDVAASDSLGPNEGVAPGEAAPPSTATASPQATRPPVEERVAEARRILSEERNLSAEQRAGLERVVSEGETEIRNRAESAIRLQREQQASLTPEQIRERAEQAVRARTAATDGEENRIAGGDRPQPGAEEIEAEERRLLGEREAARTALERERERQSPEAAALRDEAARVASSSRDQFTRRVAEVMPNLSRADREAFAQHMAGFPAGTPEYDQAMIEYMANRSIQADAATLGRLQSISPTEYRDRLNSFRERYNVVVEELRQPIIGGDYAAEMRARLETSGYTRFQRDCQADLVCRSTVLDGNPFQLGTAEVRASPTGMPSRQGTIYQADIEPITREFSDRDAAGFRKRLEGAVADRRERFTNVTIILSDEIDPVAAATGGAVPALTPRDRMAELFRLDPRLGALAVSTPGSGETARAGFQLAQGQARTQETVDTVVGVGTGVLAVGSLAAGPGGALLGRAGMIGGRAVAALGSASGSMAAGTTVLATYDAYTVVDAHVEMQQARGAAAVTGERTYLDQANAERERRNMAALAVAVSPIGATDDVARMGRWLGAGAGEARAAARVADEFPLVEAQTLAARNTPAAVIEPPPSVAALPEPRLTVVAAAIEPPPPPRLLPEAVPSPPALASLPEAARALSAPEIPRVAAVAPPPPAPPLRNDIPALPEPPAASTLARLPEAVNIPAPPRVIAANDNLQESLRAVTANDNFVPPVPSAPRAPVPLFRETGTDATVPLPRAAASVPALEPPPQAVLSRAAEPAAVIRVPEPPPTIAAANTLPAPIRAPAPPPVATELRLVEAPVAAPRVPDPPAQARIIESAPPSPAPATLARVADTPPPAAVSRNIETPQRELIEPPSRDLSSAPARELSAAPAREGGNNNFIPLPINPAPAAAAARSGTRATDIAVQQARNAAPIAPTPVARNTSANAITPSATPRSLAARADNPSSPTNTNLPQAPATGSPQSFSGTRADGSASNLGTRNLDAGNNARITAPSSPAPSASPTIINTKTTTIVRSAKTEARAAVSLAPSQAEVARVARLETPKERAQAAREKFGSRFTDRQYQAIERAHTDVPCVVGNCTREELRQKIQILRSANVSPNAAREVIEGAHAGFFNKITGALTGGGAVAKSQAAAARLEEFAREFPIGKPVSLLDSSGTIRNGRMLRHSDGDNAFIEIRDARGNPSELAVARTNLGEPITNQLERISEGARVGVPDANGLVRQGRVLSVNPREAKVEIIRADGQRLSETVPLRQLTNPEWTELSEIARRRASYRSIQEPSLEDLKARPDLHVRGPLGGLSRKKTAEAYLNEKYSADMQRLRTEMDKVGKQKNGEATYDPETESWRQCRLPACLASSEVVPDQGWKLHVSARPENADIIARYLLPYLQNSGAAHKVYRDIGFASAEVMGSPTQVGKFITIYPKSIEEAQEIANRLNRGFRTLGFDDSDFINIADDLAFAPGVYGRYGVFRETPGHENQIFNPHTKQWEVDDRSRPHPPWIEPIRVNLDPVPAPARPAVLAQAPQPVSREIPRDVPLANPATAQRAPSANSQVARAENFDPDARITLRPQNSPAPRPQTPPSSSPTARADFDPNATVRIRAPAQEDPTLVPTITRAPEAAPIQGITYERLSAADNLKVGDVYIVPRSDGSFAAGRLMRASDNQNMVLELGTTPSGRLVSTQVPANSLIRNGSEVDVLRPDGTYTRGNVVAFTQEKVLVEMIVNGQSLSKTVRVNQIRQPMRAPANEETTRMAPAVSR